MKRSIFIIGAILVALPNCVKAQYESKQGIIVDEKGSIISVEYSEDNKKAELPQSSEDFFRNYLPNVEANTYIELKKPGRSGCVRLFDQYYQGIKVEDAGYAFHYDVKGNISYIHGNYVNASAINHVPSVSKESAYKSLIAYIGVNEVSDSSIELLIKEIKEAKNKIAAPKLVYKVYICAGNPVGPIYGYVDAHTGNVLYTTSTMSNISVNGTFETIYNTGVKTAKTQQYSGSYRLYDDSRGATIHTRDLNGSEISYYGVKYEITDTDNYWHRSEKPNNLDMAMDIHWGLQQIYDRLYNVHNKNSYDNNGGAIDAYVRASINGSSLGSAWESITKSLVFASGTISYYPFATIDVIAHEFGHAITQHQIGWSASYNEFSEGLSDIWAAIMENAITGYSNDIWRIAEKEKKNGVGCFRDFSCNDSWATTKIATTYQSNYYNSSNDEYVRSGILSHWFYLLVEGGEVINDHGYYYSLNGVGMSTAENLIVKAVYDGYLSYTTTYYQIRNALENAAQAMGITGLKDKVTNAWKAVGVGNGITRLSIDGPAVISNGGVYKINNLPNGYNVTWSLADDYYGSRLNISVPEVNQCTLWRVSSHDMHDGILTAIVKKNTKEILSLSKNINVYNGFLGTYYNGQTTKQINLPYPLYIKTNNTIVVNSANLIDATISFSGSFIPSTWNFYPETGMLRFGSSSSTNATTLVNVVCKNGDTFTLPCITTTNVNQLNVIVNGDIIEISIIPSESYENEKVYLDSTLPEQYSSTNHNDWQLEIYDAVTGNNVFSQKLSERDCIINASGFKHGVYVVRAIIDGNVLSEKVILN